MEPSIKFILTLSRLPSWIRSFLSFLIQTLIGDPVTASTVLLVDNKYASDVTTLTIERDNFREEFYNWFRSGGFDALIAPVSAIPAAKINSTTMVSALAVSTFLYNVLDWPVGVVPVTKVRKGETMDDSRWKGREKEGYSKMFMDQVYGSGKVYKEIQENGEGLPVGVQVGYFSKVTDFIRL